MDRYRCKKDYIDGDHLVPIFIEGEWCNGYWEWTTEVFYVSNKEHDGPIPMYAFNSSVFNTHFYTLDEVREIEIDKVLEQ